MRHEKSSQIHTTEHDGDNTLVIHFNCSSCKGGTAPGSAHCPRCQGKGHNSSYRYANVSDALYKAVSQADSVGSAFAKLIKSNPDKYPFKRLA